MGMVCETRVCLHTEIGTNAPTASAKVLEAAS